MFPFINITNAADFGERVTTVLEALARQGVSRDDVRAEFLSSNSNKIAGQDAWERLNQLDNPTAAELATYAKALRVNTTWLITGDVRFVPDLMAETCLCWETPEHQQFNYYGITEPGSALEYNPDCPVHNLERNDLRYFLGQMQHSKKDSAQPTFL